MEVRSLYNLWSSMSTCALESAHALLNRSPKVLGVESGMEHLQMSRDGSIVLCDHPNLFLESRRVV